MAYNFNIHRFLKSDLSEVSRIKLDEMDACTSMTISHFAFSSFSDSDTIAFRVEGKERHVPVVDDIEHMVAFKKVIDATAIGPNGSMRQNDGKDIGKANYKDVVPSRPWDLPPGFRELKK